MLSKFWSKLVRPSTRAFAREGRRIPGYSFLDWLHGYVYGRWPYLYISMGAGKHPLARRVGPLADGLYRLLVRHTGAPDVTDGQNWAEGYHGKVVPLEAARQLVTIQQDISLTDLEQIVPYQRARDIVLQHPDHIVALECPCRAARPDPCRPLDVCLIVGEPFASFVIDHHPRRARWLTPGEAVEILQAEDERGHVHHAFFKDAMLDRFFAICNCCSCCCGAMHAHRTGTPMLAASGYVATVAPDLCLACGLCADACQFGALTLDDEEQMLAVIDVEACMGCGVCVAHCPEGALQLARDPAKGEPLEIHNLMARAAHET
jgi:ferredoxin